MRAIPGGAPVVQVDDDYVPLTNYPCRKGLGPGTGTSGRAFRFFLGFWLVFRESSVLVSFVIFGPMNFLFCFHIMTGVFGAGRRTNKKEMGIGGYLMIRQKRLGYGESLHAFCVGTTDC